MPRAEKAGLFIREEGQPATSELRQRKSGRGRVKTDNDSHLGVDLVDGGKVVHVLQEDGRLDDLAKGAATKG